MTISEIVNKYIEKSGISAREFSRRTGISTRYINNLISGVGNNGQPVNPTAATYEKLAAGMGINLSTLYDMMAPTPDEVGEDMQKETLEESFGYLTEDKKSDGRMVEMLVIKKLSDLDEDQLKLLSAYIDGMRSGK